MVIRRWILLAFYVLLYLIPLNLRPLWIPDETRYAEIPREMLASGNWVVPHFLGLRYFEKPIAGYWVNAISQWLLGDSNFAVRFGQAAATGLSALLIYWFGMRLWDNRRKAGAAVLIYLSSLLVYGVGTDAVLDSIFTFWMNAAMVTFYLTVQAETTRQRLWGYVLLGVSCGMGFLTKGFIALAVPVVAALPFMIQQKRFLELVRYGLVAVVVATLVSLPWSLMINHRDPDFWRYFFWVQHIKRFASEHAQHAHPFWYFLPILILGMMPWTAALPSALRSGWRAVSERRGYLYLASWVVFPVLFFSASRGKLATYILPSFAPLAMLAATGLIEYLEAGRTRAIRINAWVNTAFGIGAAATLAWMYFGKSDRLSYGAGDTSALVVGILLFLGWGLFGLLQVAKPGRRWFLTALCPLPLALFFTYALPSSVVYSKLPEAFINQNRQVLTDAGRILSDNVGLAAALAWELKRTEIDMFNNKGELEYGLGYPDVRHRYVDKAGFDGWLATARQKGSVVLMLRSKSQAFVDSLPPADRTVKRGQFTLLVYQAKST